MTLRDSWTSTQGTFSGWHGNTIYNADGTYYATDYAPDGSYRTTTTYADGSVREQGYGADGMPLSGGRLQFADGSYSASADDGKGSITTTFFGATGERLGQQTRLPDGSHGITTYKANGASSSTLYRRDGTYRRTEVDGEGQTITKDYAIGGRLLGSTVTEVNGMSSITTVLNAAGERVSQNWTEPDGTSGTSNVGSRDYYGALNRITASRSAHPQVWGKYYIPDGAGYSFDSSSSGSWWGDQWSVYDTSGNRMGANGYFLAEYLNDPTYTRSRYEASFNVGSSTKFVFDVGYEAPEHARVRTWMPVVYPMVFYYELFDWQTGVQVFGSASTSRKYLESYDYTRRTWGGFTELGAINSQVKVRFEGGYGDGKYAVLYEDGFGNVSLTGYSSSGVRLSEMWLHNDGSYGVDRYLPDGSTIGTSNSADATLHTYRTAPGASPEVASYPRDQGIFTLATQHAPTLTTDVLVAAPAPTRLDVAPSSAYRYDTITISRNSDTYRAMFNGSGDVQVGFNNHGELTLSGFRVRTDPGYDTEVLVDGTRYEWAYDVYGVPTSRIARFASGGFETYSVDAQGRVNGRNLSTTSADGSIATLRYGSTGQFIGTAVQTQPDAGQTLTRTYDAAGQLSGSTLEATDGYGNTVLSQRDAQGALVQVTTRVVTAPNETTITVYDGAGVATSIEVTRVSADGVIQTDMYTGTGQRVSTVVAVLEADGSVTTSNYDGAGQLTSFVLSRTTPERDTTITTYDGKGHKLREDVLHASGVHEYASFPLDGSSLRTTVQVNGSYQTMARDKSGEQVTTQYSAAGITLSDTWSRLDGSTGSNTYNANGSSTSVTNYSDGSRSTSTADASGTSTTRHFSASGVFLGTAVVREVQGGFESTSFNASGVKTNAVAVHADGSRAEYVYQATGAYTGTVSRVDGSRDELSGTAQGVVTISHYSASGALLSTSVNRAPVAGTATVAASTHVGQAFSFALPQALFTDSDAGDSLTYRASLVGSAYLPDWLSFDAASRTFTGTPPTGAIGNIALQVTATDRDGASATKQVSVQVSGLRSSAIAAQATTEEQAWTFTVPGSTFSAQGQVGSVTYAASLTGGAALPGWLHFDPVTRTFSGTPLNRDVGALSLSVTATDAYGSVAESTFSLSIANTNDAPVAWIPIEEQVAAMGRPWAFVVPEEAFRDVDSGDVLTITARLADGSPLPSWLAFDAATQRFTGTPPLGEPSALQVVVVATDLAGTSATTSFELAVVLGNRAPIVADPLGDQQVQEGSEAWTFSVPAGAFVDDDPGDTLTYSVRMADGSALPAWLAFDPATRSFSGTPERQDIGTLDLVITATDAAGETASDVFTLAVTRAPNLTIVGTPDADTLAGGAGDDSIDGLAAADTMSGGRGDDTYAVDDVGDVVLENAGQGADTVHASVTYGLGANVENLMLVGTNAIDGFGNDLVNTLQGNAAANTLDGGIGADSLLGSAGDDRYVVDNAGDAVVENAGEGEDTVHSAIDYTLGANLEHLVLTGTSAIDGTGNELANRIQGNTADNMLDGGAGSDTLLGGAGNDAYVLDGAGDVVSENAEEGIDTVHAGFDYTLGANLENLVLTGTAAINGFGNDLANELQGNDGNNLLDGGAGTDTMAGGAGDDVYIADNTGDVVAENAEAGTDTVYSLATLNLGANIENLVLTGTFAIDGYGNGLDNILQGNATANTLDGGAGADRLLGGTGDDRYVVDNPGDAVVENAGEGEDTVHSSVDYTLGANVENLVLTGSSPSSGQGNALVNRIQGNAADNTLDGGAGSDTMLGGVGNDSYIVDNRRDVVLENTSEGTDTVYSALSYELGANLEDLVLTGAAGTDGLGNALDNQMTGNGGDNVLLGRSGNDRLDGGAGNDVLIGGLGDDTYAFTRGSGADLVVDWGGSSGDVAQFGSGIAVEQLWFSRFGSSLVVQVIGTSDSLTVKNWYASFGHRGLGQLAQELLSHEGFRAEDLGNSFNSGGRRIDWFKSSDGRVLQEAQVQNLVEAMAAFAPPPAGQTTLSPAYQSTLLPTIAANWQ